MSQSAYTGNPDQPNMATLARMIKRATELGVRVSCPARVVSFTPGSATSAATVSVQPGLQAVYRKPDGSEDPRPLPIVPAAILGLFRGGGFKATYTPQPGDHGWLISADRSIDRWRQSGADPVAFPRDQAFAHTHNLTDSLWIPLGCPGPDGLQTSTQGYSISTDTGAPPGLEPGEVLIDPAGNVTIEGPLVTLGRQGVEFALRGTLLAQQAQLANTVLLAIPPATDPFTAVATANGAKAALHTLLAAIISGVSTKVRVQ